MPNIYYSKIINLTYYNYNHIHFVGPTKLNFHAPFVRFVACLLSLVCQYLCFFLVNLQKLVLS